MTPMDCSLPGSSVHGDSPGKNYWGGLPFPSPGDLPNPGIEPGSPTLQADALSYEPPGKTQLSYEGSLNSDCIIHEMVEHYSKADLY